MTFIGLDRTGDDGQLIITSILNVMVYYLRRLIDMAITKFLQCM